MDINTLFTELNDILELDDNIVSENTEIHLTSLSTLSMMAFLYENFEIQVKASELIKIGTVEDLINLIGSEKFN
jgi:acyl carrier protein